MPAMFAPQPIQIPDLSEFWTDDLLHHIEDRKRKITTPLLAPGTIFQWDNGFGQGIIVDLHPCQVMGAGFFGMGFDYAMLKWLPAFGRFEYPADISLSKVIHESDVCVISADQLPLWPQSPFLPGDLTAQGVQLTELLPTDEGVLIRECSAEEQQIHQHLLLAQQHYQETAVLIRRVERSSQHQPNHHRILDRYKGQIHWVSLLQQTYRNAYGYYETALLHNRGAFKTSYGL